MSYKLGRYVIKFWLAANAENSYRFSASSNLEKEKNEKTTNSYSFKKVVQTISIYPQKGRDIFCDRYFINVKLLEDILPKDMTVIGTTMHEIWKFATCHC